MSKIIVTRGLPASGKSTWAKAWVAADPANRVRVNRDAIRWTQGIRTGVGTHEQEQLVTLIEEGIVKAAVAKKKDVVVDATHLRASFAARWYKFGAEVEFMDFNVRVDECQRRDIARAVAGERSVGTAVIEQMAQRFGIKADGTLPAWPRNTGALVGLNPAPEWSHQKTDAIIVDIDGTLANHEPHRGPYDTSLYHLDTVHSNVAEIVFVLSETYPVIITSGRSDEFRDVTAKWLTDNSIPFDRLIMRKAGDLRNDALVKHDLFHEFIAPDFNVVMVFDDRNRVVEAWREMGLTVAQVAEGAF